MEIIFACVFCKQLFAFLTASAIPISKFCIIYIQCLVCFSFSVQNFCAHIPSAETNIFISTAINYLVANAEKLILMRDKNSRVVISRIACDIPHIIIHYPIVIGIVTISLSDEFAGLFGTDF